MKDLKEHRAGLVEHIQQSTLLQTWPECRSALLEDDATTDWAIQLVVGACQAVGGAAKIAYPVAAAWSSLNVAAHLLDQAQDGAAVSRAKAESLSVALIFTAYDFLADVSPQAVNRVMRIFSGTGFDSVLGQIKGFGLGRDAAPTTTLESYWESVILKSGSLIKMATAGGAAIATADEELINALAGYGEAFGTILQILDDCRDVIDEQERYEITLPVLLYSLAVGSQTVTFPMAQSRDVLLKELAGTNTLQAISSVLLHWQQSCLDSLSILPPNEAVDVLKELVHSQLNHGLTLRE